jgi:broad specificity phosphatase PhoE
MCRVTTLLLARHGETDWNRARRWQGFADRPLTERGKAQARALAERLADIALDAVYSSDLRRARETAEAVTVAQGLEVIQLPELREVDVGSWEGLTRDEAEERFPKGFQRWRDGGTGWDDGETYGEMSRRVLEALDRIARDREGGRVLIVTHGGPIRAIHAAALGLDVEAYRRIRPVEPNARLSAVCAVDGRLTELCPAGGIDELLARD